MTMHDVENGGSTGPGVRGLRTKGKSEEAAGHTRGAAARGLDGAPVGVPRKILVAAEHEGHAALKLALALAGPLHAQIAVVDVAEPLAVTAAESPEIFAQAIEQVRARAAETLQAIGREIPENARAFTFLREGFAATEILEAAREWQAELIVMGTHRRGPLARMLLGSTSQGVLRRATCPVMLVSDVAAACEKPEKEGSKGGGP